MDLFENDDINLEKTMNVSSKELANTELKSFKNIRINMHFKFNQGTYAEDRSSEWKKNILESALKDYQIFMQKGIELNSDESQNLTALQAMITLQLVLLRIHDQKLKVEKINFQQMKTLLVDAYYYSYAAEPFLTLSYTFFYVFLRDYYMHSALVWYTLCDHKLQQACKLNANKLDEMLNLMTRGDFLHMKIASLHDASLEYLQRLWMYPAPIDVDENAKLVEALYKLKIPISLPCYIKNVKEADKCFKLVQEKSQEAIEYVNRNKQALDRIDAVFNNKKSTDDVIFGAKFLVGFAYSKHAVFKNTKEKTRMHDKSLNLLQELKISMTYITEDNADVFAKMMLQIAESLLFIMKPFMEEKNAQLEQYSLKFIAHYKDFEKFVDELDFDIGENSIVMSSCAALYKLAENFFRDVKNDEKKAKSVARKAAKLEKSFADFDPSMSFEEVAALISQMMGRH